MLLVDSRWWMFTVQFFQHFCTLELLRASRTTDSISLLEYRNPPALPALACCLALILKSVWDFGINAISQQRRGALTRGASPFRRQHCSTPAVLCRLPGSGTAPTSEPPALKEQSSESCLCPASFLS